MIKDSIENRKKCVCPKCPSYALDCQGEVLYCAVGKSKCAIKIKACLCNICPIYFENKLKNIYFCDKDSLQGSRNLMRQRRAKEDADFYKTVRQIKEIANSGKSVVEAMGSRKKIQFSFDNIHFIPAQIHKIPLNQGEKVKSEVVIGPQSRKPLKISSPIMISAMSFGAVSRSVKLVIAEVARKLKIGFNSGEGGMLQEEIEKASDYIIGQYATGGYGLNENALKKISAIEIRFGQGAYPGRGSYLPSEKITSEIAEVRNLKLGEASYSPAHHFDILNLKDLKNKIYYFKKVTNGIPIGAKIGCGNVEKDIKVLVEAEVDFIVLDGFGGGTGATDISWRDNVGIPIIAALPRAFNYLNKLNAKKRITLIASGGLRTSADFAKCMALGADAVYVGTAALIAINCEQYRICQTGLCPTGIATQNPALEKQIILKEGIKKLANFINISTEEISSVTRSVGKNAIKNLEIDDLIALDKNLASLTGIKWLDGNNY